MSHVTIYSLAMLSTQAQSSAEARQRAEQLVLSELGRNFVQLAQRQEDALGNLRLLLKVNSNAVPDKTGEIEIVIGEDNTLSIDVSNAPGKTCAEITAPLEMALGNPISRRYKPEYYDGKTRITNQQQSKL